MVNSKPSRRIRINLLANALIMESINSNTCNDKPERLVITTEASQPPNQCNSTNNRLVLNGNSLPAAWVLMRQGIVSLDSDTELNGLIWTHSFCSNNHRLKLRSQNQRLGSKTFVQNASTLWGWNSKGFAGYGRKITRGIRGTGLDQFQRF